MKKILSLVISAVIVVAIAIGILFGIKAYRDNKEYSLKASASAGGTIEITIDDTQYLVLPNNNRTFTVKKKSNISLIAKPSENYTFTAWQLNGSEHSKQTNIDLTVTKKTNIHAAFTAKTVNVTVTDSTGDSNNFEFSLTENLLEELNSRYTPASGYRYVYKLNGNEITSSTKITENATITREKVLIEYTVVFKHNGQQVGETQTYTVENKTITTPDVPSETGYTVAWETFSLDSLGNIEVNTIKTPIDYTITYNLPDGFAFADNTTSVNKIYHITDTAESVEKPSFDNITLEAHYELSIPEITLTYDENNAVVVNIVKQPKEYTVTFKVGDEIKGTDTYTIEDKTITTPEVPDVAFYENEAWPTVEIPAELGDFDVELTKTATNYTIKYVLPQGYIFSNQSNEFTQTYSIENLDTETNTITETRPDLPVARAGYSLAWEDVTITLENLETLTQINVVESMVTYTATFAFEGTTVDTVEYTIDTVNSITAPALPVAEGYTVKWEAYSFDSSNLENKTINALKLVPIKVSYIIDEFAVAYDYTNYSFTTIYVAIDASSNVVTDGTNPIVYKLKITDTTQAEVNTELLTTITGAVHNPTDSTDVPVITKLQLIDGSSAEISNVQISDNLAEQLNIMLNACKTKGYTIKVTYEDPSIE